MSLKMERIYWVQTSRVQASSRPESKRPESKYPDAQSPGVQSPSVQASRVQPSNLSEFKHPDRESRVQLFGYAIKKRRR